MKAKTYFPMDYLQMNPANVSAQEGKVTMGDRGVEEVRKEVSYLTIEGEQVERDGEVIQDKEGIESGIMVGTDQVRDTEGCSVQEKESDLGQNAAEEYKEVEVKPTIRIGLVGHSLVRQYPTYMFPQHFDIQTIKYESQIKSFHSKQRYRELIEHTPHLDTVLFIIGGNDIDDQDHTEEHIRDITYTYMNTTHRLYKNNIRPYMLPIQPRKSPKHTTAIDYNHQAGIINVSMSSYSKRMFGYDAMIPCLFEDRQLKRDGIHLTARDYTTITKQITQHITTNIDIAPDITLLPVEKNRGFLREENRLREVRLRWQREEQERRLELERQGQLRPSKIRKIEGNARTHMVEGSTENPSTSGLRNMGERRVEEIAGDELEGGLEESIRGRDRRSLDYTRGMIKGTKRKH